MNPVFADTFYFLALVNSSDGAHDAATAFSKTRGARFITTAWVLTEIADGMCAPPQRDVAVDLIEDLRNDPNVTIIPVSPELSDRGWKLYCQRPDKAWSLTDCISFVVMQDHHLTDALTGDHHFEQAGFSALFRNVKHQRSR